MKAGHRLLLKLCIMAPLAATLVWLLGSNVHDEPTDTEVALMEEFFEGHACGHAEVFDAQVECVRSLQHLLALKITNRRCAGRFIEAEPTSFIERGYGCCFDRARILEKMLVHLGFKVRRVALFDSDQKGVWSIFIPGIASHATLEVQTELGWMGADSNHEFVLIDSYGTPHTYRTALADPSIFDEMLIPSDFYKKRLKVIYGLYSRHGMSHWPMIPGPEINWDQFWSHNFNN